MATKTFEELKQMAIQIRDEKTNKQNTATRIGTQMLEHLNMLEQEYYDKTTLDKRTTELNISVLYPTLGVNGTNKYTLAGAIAQVPADYRSIRGLNITFVNNDTDKIDTWKYNGGTFTAISNWKIFGKEAEITDKILTWNIDAETTRTQVKVEERKQGLQISYYHPTDGWIDEKYIGETVEDSSWQKNGNWLSLDFKKVINSITYNDILKNVAMIGSPIKENIPIHISIKNTGENKATIFFCSQEWFSKYRNFTRYRLSRYRTSANKGI